MLHMGIEIKEWTDLYDQCLAVKNVTHWYKDRIHINSQNMLECYSKWAKDQYETLNLRKLIVALLQCTLVPTKQNCEVFNSEFYIEQLYLMINLLNGNTRNK